MQNVSKSDLVQDAGLGVGVGEAGEVDGFERLEVVQRLLSLVLAPGSEDPCHQIHNSTYSNSLTFQCSLICEIPK